MRRFALVCLVLFVYAAVLSAQISVPKVPSGRKKPDVNVERANMPTPEVEVVSPKEVTAGTPAVVSIKIKNFDANRLKSVKAYGDCEKAVSGFQVVSATEVRFTLNVSREATGSSCNGSFLDVKNSSVLSWNVRYLNNREQEQKALAAKMQQEASQPYEVQEARAKQMVGKQWTLAFDSGAKDTLNLTKNDGMTGIFKNSAGKQVKVTYMYGQVMIEYAENCMLQGKMDGKSAKGMALGQGCPGGKAMTNWSGTVQ